MNTTPIRLTEDELMTEATRLIGAVYPHLIHQLGPEAWNNDRYIIAIIHAISTASAGVYVESDNSAKDSQSVFFPLCNEIMFANVAIYIWLRRGRPVVSTRHEVKTIVQSYAMGEVYNPIQRNTMLLSDLIKGVTRFLAGDEEAPFAVIVPALISAYDAFQKADTPQNLRPAMPRPLIDDDLAAAVIYRLWKSTWPLQSLPEEPAYLVRSASDTVSAVVAAMHLAANSTSDHDRAYHGMVQTWGNLLTDLVQNTDGVNILRIRDFASKANPAEARMMLSTLMAPTQAMSRLASIIMSITDANDIDDVLPQLARSVREVTTSYWDNESASRSKVQ